MITALSERFRIVKSVWPNVGDYIILSKAVRGMKYRRMVIYSAFNKYVPKQDYLASEKDMLMDSLVGVTNSDGVPELNGYIEPSVK